MFGEGPEDARVVFVGEQPGDQEDIAGKPFVGPAGKVFDEILDEADIDRLKVYVTNAVKHFKFEPRGKRRIHAKPNAGEVQACRWWLDKELTVIKPDLVVALGATAAQSLLGKPIAVTKMRGQTVEREDGLKVFVTIHPSFILRIREPDDKEAERARFLDGYEGCAQTRFRLIKPMKARLTRRHASLRIDPRRFVVRLQCATFPFLPRSLRQSGRCASMVKRPKTPSSAAFCWVWNDSRSSRSSAVEAEAQLRRNADRRIRPPPARRLPDIPDLQRKILHRDRRKRPLASAERQPILSSPCTD